MASSSDRSKQDAVFRNQNKAPLKFLVPLIYAPVLPMIRIAFRKNPVVRDRLFTVVLAGAFAHGMYLVYKFVPEMQFGPQWYKPYQVQLMEVRGTDIYDSESK